MTTTALIKRLEALDAPCRECDVLIALTMPDRFFDNGPRNEYTDIHDIGTFNDDGSRSLPGNGPLMLVPAYTASIDVAMTLVPEGAYSLWCSFALPYPYHAAVSALPFMTQDERTKATVCHQSMPIALCIAALKAQETANGR